MKTYHGIGYVGVYGPNVSLHEERTQIRTPCISSPAKNLLQKPPIGFHGTEKLSLFATLNVRAPPVADHPTSKELVVSRVQLILAKPVVVGEAMKEFRIFEDDGAVCGCTTREARNTAINVRGR